MPKILVTGATGFIGSHLLYHLLHNGMQVRAIKRSASSVHWIKKIFSSYTPDAEKLLNNVEWVDGDILDYTSIHAAMQGISEVYHAAAWVSFDPAEKTAMVNNNMRGTANIVNAAMACGIRKLCHVSSIAAIGEPADGVLANEETHIENLKNISSYSLSKLLSEYEVWRGVAEGLNAVIVNPSVVLGTGNWSAGSPSLFSRVWKGMPFYPPGSNGFVDVRDVVAVMVQLMQSDISGERFVVSSENLPMRTILNITAQHLHKKPPAYSAGKILMGALWRLETVRSRIIRKRPLITSESAKSALQNIGYSNKKISDAIGYKFRPISESIADISRTFLAEHQVK